MANTVIPARVRGVRAGPCGGTPNEVCTRAFGATIAGAKGEGRRANGEGGESWVRRAEANTVIEVGGTMGLG